MRLKMNSQQKIALIGFFIGLFMVANLSIYSNRYTRYIVIFGFILSLFCSLAYSIFQYNPLSTKKPIVKSNCENPIVSKIFTDVDLDPINNLASAFNYQKCSNYEINKIHGLFWSSLYEKQDYIKTPYYHASFASSKRSLTRTDEEKVVLNYDRLLSSYIKKTKEPTGYIMLKNEHQKFKKLYSD